MGVAVREGLGLVRGTKKIYPNRGAKQNRAAGEGLELVRGTNESQSEYRGHHEE